SAGIIFFPVLAGAFGAAWHIVFVPILQHGSALDDPSSGHFNAHAEIRRDMPRIFPNKGAELGLGATNQGRPVRAIGRPRCNPILLGGHHAIIDNVGPFFFDVGKGKPENIGTDGGAFSRVGAHRKENERVCVEMFACSGEYLARAFVLLPNALPFADRIKLVTFPAGGSVCADTGAWWRWVEPGRSLAQQERREDAGMIDDI